MVVFMPNGLFGLGRITVRRFMLGSRHA